MADDAPPARPTFPRLPTLLGGGLGYLVGRRTDAPDGGPARIRALFTDGLGEVIEVGLIVGGLAAVLIGLIALFSEAGTWRQRLTLATGVGAIIGGVVFVRLLVVALFLMLLAAVVAWAAWGIGPWRGAVVGACLLGFLALLVRLAVYYDAIDKRAGSTS